MIRNQGRSILNGSPFFFFIFAEFENFHLRFLAGRDAFHLNEILQDFLVTNERRRRNRCRAVDCQHAGNLSDCRIRLFRVSPLCSSTTLCLTPNWLRCSIESNARKSDCSRSSTLVINRTRKTRAYAEISWMLLKPIEGNTVCRRIWILGRIE